MTTCTQAQHAASLRNRYLHEMLEPQENWVRNRFSCCKIECFYHLEIIDADVLFKYYTIELDWYTHTQIQSLQS